MAKRPKRKNLPDWGLLFILAVVSIVLIMYFGKENGQGIGSFEECVAAGYPVAESIPRRCTTPDGSTFIESGVPPEPPPSPGEDFCGSSTDGECTIDSDCATGGCSGQVCQSVSEEPVVTTCEWRDCYSARTYGFGCMCMDGSCQWVKVVTASECCMAAKGMCTARPVSGCESGQTEVSCGAQVCNERAV